MSDAKHFQKDATTYSYLSDVIQRIPGLLGIDVSHASEGKVLVSVHLPSVDDQDNEFAVAFKTFDQSSKLGLGQSKAITSFYDNGVVVHVKHEPLLTSFFADKGTDVGSIHSAAEEVKQALEPLRQHVERAEQ